MNIVLIGHARHGKDTVAEILERDYGLTFESSSVFAGKKCVYPTMKKEFGYRTFQECFEDRVNHRKVWYTLIKNYNTPDKTRLGREIFKVNDIYVGIRDREEFEALVAERIPDVVIWVDAHKRKPPESLESMKLTQDDADIILDNNGTEEELVENVHKLMDSLQYEATTLEETS